MASLESNALRVCEIVGNMNGGGVESVVMNYYRHIDRSRVQFDFVATEGSTYVPRSEIESLGGRVFLVPPYVHLPQFQGSLRHLFAEHREWNIVHSHMNALNCFPLQMAEQAGIPIRISHSHSSSGAREHAKNIIKALLKTQANRYPTHRFACSDYAGKWLFGNNASFEIMYNAIDLESFAFDLAKRVQVRNSLGVRDSQLLVGHVGRFMPQKNHEFLIHAFKYLALQRPDAVLALVGSGEDEPSIKRLVNKLGLTERVLFLGQRNDVDQLCQAFDIFVLPSLYEGLGVVAIEAQAAGLPCILSDKVPLEADVTGSCVFLPIDDPMVWADALKQTVVKDCTERKSIEYQQFHNYDINRQGIWLTNRYLDLFRSINQ